MSTHDDFSIFLCYMFGQARLWIVLDHTWGDDGVLDVKLRGQKWALVTQFDSVKRLTKYKAIAGPSFKKFKDPGICFFGSCKEYLPERGTWVRTHIYMMVILDRFLDCSFSVTIGGVPVLWSRKRYCDLSLPSLSADKF